MNRMNLGTLNLVENSFMSKTFEITLALMLLNIALTLFPVFNLLISLEKRG